MKKTTILASTFALAFVPLTINSSAMAASAVWGTLICDSEGGLGQVFTSKKEFLCNFKPVNRNLPASTYLGQINNYGIDLGLTGRTKMVWSVLAATKYPYTSDALSGRYYGVGSSVGFAAGASSQLLGFGPRNGLTLQPLSIDVHEGVNLALGVSRLKLMPVVATK